MRRTSSSVLIPRVVIASEICHEMTRRNAGIFFSSMPLALRNSSKVWSSKVVIQPE